MEAGSTPETGLTFKKGRLTEKPHLNINLKGGWRNGCLVEKQGVSICQDPVARSLPGEHENQPTSGEASEAAAG